MNERIKELAEQAGMTNTLGCFWQSGDYDLERFAEYVAADEREACAEHYLGIMRDAVEQAVLAEREACAKLCDEHLLLGNRFSRAIRQRGEK